MKLSMGAWAFAFGPYAADPKSIEEIAHRLSKARYDGIELSSFEPHVTLNRYASKESRQALVRMLSDLGLGVSGFSADFGLINPLVPEDRNAYLDRFARYLELCADVGSPSIRVDTGTVPGALSDTEYQAAFRHLADVWRDCADLSRQAQVPIVWEFEPGYAFNKPSEVVELHQRVGHPWFQILFDTAHAYMCAVVGARQHGERETLEGGIVEFLDNLHDSIGAVHLDDSDGTLFNYETSTHVPFGQGRVPFDRIAPRLAALPHVEWWCVDLCFCPDAWERVEESREQAERIKALASGKTPA